MPKLVHILDGAVLGEVSLDGVSDLRIGRAAENEVRLDDLTVSGRHAAITLQASPYIDGHVDAHLEDLGSTNGTQVNGRVIGRHLLKHDDRIQIGHHELRFVDEANVGFERTRIYLDDESE